MNKIIEEDIVKILSMNLDWEILKNRNVLITGATGMIGQYLTYLLLELNKTRDLNIGIFAICRNIKKANNLFEEYKNNSNFNIVIQDVTENIKIENKIDYIIHTASPANPVVFSNNPVDTIKANTLGTINTLELAKKFKAKYCYISTMEIYGQMNEIYEIEEEDYGAINSLEVRSCYPESKKMGENICIAYNSQYDIETKIIRPAHTYGPGMVLDDPRVQCEFMNNVINDKDIVMKSDGKMKRTYTYIADVVSGIIFAVLKGKEKVYNVANDDAVISIKGLAETIIKAKENAKSKLIIQISDEKGWSKVQPKIMDCNKLKKLGWKPLYSVENGIKRTMKYHMGMKKEEN